MAMKLVSLQISFDGLNGENKTGIKDKTEKNT